MLLYLLLTSFLAGRALGAACLQDNLLRAFIQSSIPAASFCATYTKGPNSPLPTFVTATYGSSRFSSACTCIATLSSAASTTSSPPSHTTSTTSSTLGISLSTVTVTQAASTITQPASTVTISASTITESASTITLTLPASTITISDISTAVTTATQLASTTTVTSISTPASCVTCPSGLPTLCGATCVDTLTSTPNCGACGNSCSHFDNSITNCASGFCGLEVCPTYSYDCDKNPTNGCEQPVDFNNCGGCGIKCTEVYPSAPTRCQFRDGIAICQCFGCLTGASTGTRMWEP